MGYKWKYINDDEMREGSTTIETSSSEEDDKE